MDFRVSGAGNTASTEVAKDIGIRHFTMYLRHENKIHGTDTWESLSEHEICSENIIKGFATYLNSRTSGENKKFGASTIKQYISATMTKLRNKFTNNSIISADAAWITKLRMDIEKVHGRECIAAGVAIEDKSLPIGRTVLKNMCEYLLDEGIIIILIDK
jgi:hypothetical protein